MATARNPMPARAITGATATTPQANSAATTTPTATATTPPATAGNTPAERNETKTERSKRLQAEKAAEVALAAKKAAADAKAAAKKAKEAADAAVKAKREEAAKRIVIIKDSSEHVARMLTAEQKAERDDIEAKMEVAWGAMQTNGARFLAYAEQIRQRGLANDFAGGFIAYMADRWKLSLAHMHRIKDFSANQAKLAQYKIESPSASGVPSGDGGGGVAGFNEGMNREIVRLGRNVPAETIAAVIVEAAVIAKERGGPRATAADVKVAVDKRMGFTGDSSDGVTAGDTNGDGAAITGGGGDMETDVVRITTRNFRTWHEAIVQSDPADTASPMNHYVIEEIRARVAGAKATYKLAINDTPDIESDSISSIIKRATEYANESMRQWRAAHAPEATDEDTDDTEDADPLSDDVPGEDFDPDAAGEGDGDDLTAKDDGEDEYGEDEEGEDHEEDEEGEEDDEE